jgi:RNA polymerase sigma-70 factor, ECF subfamily
MDQQQEQQVIAAILAGDTDAYAILVNRYQQPIFNLVFRMTSSYADATDLAQEAFIRAYEQLYRFRLGQKFFPWVYTIALNQTRNFLRKNKAQKTLPLDDCEPVSGLDYPAQQEEMLCAQLDGQRVQDALARLSFDYREAVILRYREELSMEDIATALEISVSGAKMRVHRGLRKLRELMRTDDHGKQNAF